MAKKEVIFEPRKIDSVATEVSRGMVQIGDLPDLVPLADYLTNKEEELRHLKERESVLYRDVKDYIKQSLSVRSSQWQEECRRLSWAYSSSGDQNNLKGLYRICPDMTLLSPWESEVAAHHLSHLIRAYLATIENLPPVDRGQAPNIVMRADEQEQALQAKILCWEYLLSLQRSGEVKPSVRRQTQLDIIQKQNEEILELLRFMAAPKTAKKKV